MCVCVCACVYVCVCVHALQPATIYGGTENLSTLQHDEVSAFFF